MKKIFFLAAGVMLTASAVQAQTGNGSDATATATASVSGLFSPRPGGTVSTVGATITLAASTPVTSTPVPSGSSAQSNVAALVGGSQAAVAGFTAALTNAGVTGVAAQALANALGALQNNGVQTVGSVSVAVAAWNAAIQTMTQPQLAALARSGQGSAAIAQMRAARNGVRNAART